MDEAHGPSRAAVLGSPIGHSLSPLLHRAAYAALGLAWRYDAIEVEESGLRSFLGRLDDTWAGLSLTMPLKETVIDLLDRVDDTARAVRSVNTVIPAGGGWFGTNTDIYGMTQALTSAGLAGDRDTAVILGAGATARSAVAALARLGTRSVTVCARRSEAADEVARLISDLGMAGSTADLVPDEALLARDVVISTLPGDVGEPWSRFTGQHQGALLDASYYPWPTPLAAAWTGSVVASGRDMLLWQAVEQVRLMTGLEPPVEAMAAALPA